MGVYYKLSTLLGPKNSLPTLAALVGNLFWSFVLVFASQKFFLGA